MCEILKGTSLMSSGHHIAAWRHPDAPADGGLNFQHFRQAIAGARGHRTIFGTPITIADQLEEWFVNGGADGFNIMPPFLPGGLDEFVDLVIPELQRQGLFRTEYEGHTLRENLGLLRPLNRFTQLADVSELVTAR